MEIVLDSYGSSLSRDKDGFVAVSDGGRQRIPAAGIDRIRISPGTQITSDAVLLAIENEIEIIFADRRGRPMGLLWSPRYGSISTIRKGQLAFSSSKDAAIWIRDVIAQKVMNQQTLILALCGRDDLRVYVSQSVSALAGIADRIRELSGESVSEISQELRGLEGQAAHVYFSMMNLCLPEKLRFESRSQHPATDTTNAFLNYAYGMLYSCIEGALIRAGIDPYIGILHMDDYCRPVLVFNVIELYRTWADRVVYTLLSQELETDDLCSVREDGAFWLESLGRRILSQSVNDYLDEVVTENGVKRSRRTSIELYAQALAQKFKGYANDNDRKPE